MDANEFARMVAGLRYDGEEIDGDECDECGEPMFTTDTGVTHHGEPDEIDYDADADHTAVCRYVMENDDAVDSVGNLVGIAREILANTDRSQQTVWRITVADLDNAAGRALTDDELTTFAECMGRSSVQETVDTILIEAMGIYPPEDDNEPNDDGEAEQDENSPERREAHDAEVASP